MLDGHVVVYGVTYVGVIKLYFLQFIPHPSSLLEIVGAIFFGQNFKCNNFIIWGCLFHFILFMEFFPHLPKKYIYSCRDH